MGYSETWKILEEIVIELRKKGNPAPENVMGDLKSAKTLIKLLAIGEDRGEIGPKIEQYLASVEASLVTEAQKTFPTERIDEWLRRLEASSCEDAQFRRQGLPKTSIASFPACPETRNGFESHRLPACQKRNWKNSPKTADFQLKQRKMGI